MKPNDIKTIKAFKTQAGVLKVGNKTAAICNSNYPVTKYTVATLNTLRRLSSLRRVIASKLIYIYKNSVAYKKYHNQNIK
jgi:hypothetical protein